MRTVGSEYQDFIASLFQKCFFLIAVLTLISCCCEGWWEIICTKHTLTLASSSLPFGRRYVKHSPSPNSESRASASASASATFASSSQAAECSSSGVSGSLAGCASPLSEGASHCAGSSNGSNHSGTCNETNGLYDGEQPQEPSSLN